MKKHYSNGKLLLTGEYLILDGALSLAVPTQFGQSLTVEPVDEPKLIWKSLDNEGNVWFEGEFLLQNNEILNQYRKLSEQDGNDVSIKLLQILNATKQLNPDFLSTQNGFDVTTKLDFPQFWGLGSSSTLINNIADWAKVDAYKLLEKTFGGSGYDIACAQHNCPVTYQLKNSNRSINEIDFNPNFKDHLYFVHLNKKQNSRDAIAHYNSNKNNYDLAISEIRDITSKIITCNSLDVFETLITAHEQIISKAIKQKSVKDLLFNDYKGAIKSLGAWGGDFVLVTGNVEMMKYFRHKGYYTIISYNEMVLTKPLWTGSP